LGLAFGALLGVLACPGCARLGLRTFVRQTRILLPRAGEMLELVNRMRLPLSIPCSRRFEVVEVIEGDTDA
jgi:hypothetical protein